MSTKDIKAQLEQFKELQKLVEEAQAEMEAIKDSLKAEMTARGVDTLTAGAFRANWQTVKGSRFDSAAFKRENAELYSRYTTQTVTRRFTVA